MLPKRITSIPGPQSKKLLRQLHQYESQNITFQNDHFPIIWDRADGALVWDADGNRYLDLTSAFAVATLGHTAPALRDALIAQAHILFHAMGDVHPCKTKVELCQKLSEITFERWGLGPAKTYLGNSGSEAVEAALKTALLATGKPGVLSFTGGYHGLGHGALETTGLPFFREPFKSQLGRFGVQVTYPNCFRCPFEQSEGFRLEGNPFPNCSNCCLEKIQNELESLLKRREIGCILVEPIQGRGGDIVPPRDFLRLLRNICDTTKTLLIFDEIYTGFHRTGRLFACDHFGVTPDIICLAKGLSGGFPISACVGRRDIMDAWPISKGEALHTSTTLGNPLGCAMALASIQEHLNPKTQHTAQTVATNLETALRALEAKAIGNIRGIGLLWGIELIQADGSPNSCLAQACIQQALQDGLLILAGGPDGNVLSLTPSLPITQAQISFAVAKLQEYFTSLPGSIS